MEKFYNIRSNPLTINRGFVGPLAPRLSPGNPLEVEMGAKAKKKSKKGNRQEVTVKTKVTMGKRPKPKKGSRHRR